MKTKRQNPIHPGEILSEEFLKPMGITQYRLALDIRVPPRRINEIVLGKRGISADTALRLARYLGTSVDVWMNLQTRFEVETVRDEEGEIIEREINPAQTLVAVSA
ncbi:MAG: HigA family addiction module antitoxin [Verrucomicrobiota bacterium]